MESSGNNSFYIRGAITLEADLNEFLANHKFRHFSVCTTPCGFIVSFLRADEADRFSRLKLPGIFLNVTRLNGNKSGGYQQAVFLQQVPSTIPIEDIKQALKEEGILKVQVERKRHHVRVEVYEPEDFNRLLQGGLNFFGVTRFAAIPDRGLKTSINWHDRRSNLSTDGKFVLQCYHCQGFWHMAEDCKNPVRCIRCGGGHNVEICLRPRSDALCCNCSGPHHAAYKFCPVRLDLVNAVPIQMTLSTEENGQPPTHLV